MTGSEFFKAVDEGMAEVSAKLTSGELDGSGRYWTDEELATGIASEDKLSPLPIETRPSQN